ncbi:MAG: DUF554 domain-containing protein [Phascolarctobacterium sp.]|uniref:DUF554 domain-containing protein n=1 Tax=Phascolarctobacterium sp. TaxID=2049039 RepID=UPI0026DDADF5|nr:DUF554 domain-containing protein [Phascolarctobacterium sp.]MDO4922155.1 DUF554 domain-containing protein [Phascolarctobacterium sp.]
MPGLGTVANCAAIVSGALLGVLFKRGLPEKWQQTMMSGIALCIVLIGVQMALKTNNIIIVIFSIALGSIAGEIVDIEKWMTRLGEKMGAKLGGGDVGVAARIAEGFVSASILFCSGAMAIVGSIQDGLAADHTTLFAKATLDGLIALILSANVGVGVLLSAASVGIYQGSLTLLASVVGALLTDAMLLEITAAGGVMIMAIGTNMLHITKIRIGNMLPGMVFAAVLTKIFL